MLNYFVFQVIKWAYWGKYPPLISSEPGEGGENWINLDFSFSWHWLACNFITDHREFDIQIRSAVTTPCLASTSTVSNYMPAAGHRKIMRRESQKVGLCSAQVISQPEHFTQLNPGAIVHNLSFISGKTPAALCTIHCIHFGQFRTFLFLYNISKYCSQVSYSREWVNRITFVVRHSWRFSFSLLYQIQFAV